MRTSRQLICVHLESCAIAILGAGGQGPQNDVLCRTQQGKHPFLITISQPTIPRFTSRLGPPETLRARWPWTDSSVPPLPLLLPYTNNATHVLLSLLPRSLVLLTCDAVPHPILLPSQTRQTSTTPPGISIHPSSQHPCLSLCALRFLIKFYVYRCYCCYVP